MLGSAKVVPVDRLSYRHSLDNIVDIVHHIVPDV